MLDVLDAILNVGEPGGAVDPATSLRTATSGATVDHTGARPFSIDLVADRWFAWLLEDVHRNPETGPAVREDFAFAVLYVDDAGEQAAQVRSRATSQQMETRAHGFLDRLAAQQANATWLDIRGAIDRAVITGFSVRGIGLRVSGWRYRPA